MPSFFKKAPKQLSLEYSEGVEKKRKFAIGRVIKWGLIIYCFIVFRSCFSNIGQTPQQPVKGKANYQTVEQMLPSSLKHYDASKLEFKKAFTLNEVYQNGIQLGSLVETHVLTNSEGEAVGYLNNSGVYNSLGQRTGNVYKGGIIDLYGCEVGTLKSKDKDLESIVDSTGKELAKVKGVSHIIVTKKPNSEEYTLVGIVDNYESYIKKVKEKGPFDNLFN